jgi:HSP20 family protein
MPLIPSDPFEMFRRDFSILPSFPQIYTGQDWMNANLVRGPRVEVRQNQNEVIVTADLPGIEKKEDVNIVVHDNHLHLSGQINRIHEQKNENVYHTERYYGHFSRMIPLPASVDEDGAKATYKNGVLEIRIPKASVQRRKTIDVDFH